MRYIRKFIPVLFIGIIYFLGMQNPKLFFENIQLFTILAFVIILIFTVLPRFFKSKPKSNYKFKENISLNNTTEEFENLYNTLYTNHIVDLEKLRQKAKKESIIYSLLMFVSIVGYGTSRLRLLDKWPLVSIIVSIVALLSFAILFFCILKVFKNRGKYQETYKNEIVSNFIKLIGSDLKYSQGINYNNECKEKYTDAKFDNQPFNIFFSDDHIEGMLDSQVYINAADINVSNRVGSGKNSYIEYVFNGIFAYTKCTKDIGTSVKVCKNKVKILNKKDIVAMDSAEFEKYFDIYSDNKILAMQILTSDIMTDLIDFHNKYNLDFEIVFKNDTIYVRFFTGPMFEPKTFGSSMDKQLLFIYYSILQFVANVTKKVNKTLENLEI